MTTTASLPTPAHQLSNPASSPKETTTRDVNYQGLPIPRGPVTASLSFYKAPEDGSAPHSYVEPPPGVPQLNWGNDWENVKIEDLRGQEHKFTLDNNAFATFQNIKSGLDKAGFDDDEAIKRVYYPEVEDLLLKNVQGAQRVFLFDHTIRRPTGNRTPVQRVHIDQTPYSAAQRVKHHLPDEAEKLLQGRYRIINVWRPLNGPVMGNPLAVADSQTVQDGDLVPIEHRYPDRTGQTASVAYNPEQKWYYWSGMTNEDRLLLKCFDSDEDFGKWGRVPHTAFTDPRTPEGAVGRESIEIRALVFG
ncbi:methyltransferase [Pyrenophora seminiperda CCB06]|uniref:Methyltransferase n=1 Tax=Pyrenophora seminiperda CCB06 TaxID=1302712 RepID=A0A3M7MG32_9PLEO|nr:methyltransferase [Pyrenophora seminiperda CCB06]